MEPTRRTIGSIGLCIVVAAAAGCASGGPRSGWRADAIPASTPTALNTYPASTTMTQKYGITEWRFFVGKSQMVITGYAADGSPARGVQVAWFQSVPGSVGHTRLMMLDGSGATLRRMVGGGKTGQLTADQAELFQTMRYDLQRAPRASGSIQGASAGGGGLHVLDDPGGPSGIPAGNTPGTGPQCMNAWTDPSIAVDGAGCAYGAATFETVVGGVIAILSCTQWFTEVEAAKSTCSTEDASSCNTDTPPTCTFGQPSTPTTPTTPAPACDTACLCANYPKTAQGCGTVGPCTYDSDCGTGETCQSKICQATPAQNDNPTDQNLANANTSAPSCASGDVSADPSTGQVACSNGSASGGGSSGGSSGGTSSGSSSSGGGSTDTTGTDPTGTDPGTGGSSSGGSSGSSSGGGCANDGESCAQDSDCCGGSCSSGTCGAATAPDSGGACASDGASCSQDSDCCGGSCSSGTCGASTAPDSGGACASDGSSCSQDSDCCGGTCSSGTCGAAAAPTCGNPGDGCAADSDCCSGSCDQASGTCN
jgi:hypothetical protein